MKYLNKSKQPWHYIFVLGFLNIIDGLIMMLTLGNYTSQLTFPYITNFHKRKRLKNE